jgi:hypothetical protein
MARRDRGDVSAGRGSLRTVAAGGGVDARRNEGTVSAEFAALGLDWGATASERGVAAVGVPSTAVGVARGTAVFSFVAGRGGGIAAGCVLATCGAVSVVRGGAAVEAPSGALKDAAVRGSGDDIVRAVVGVAVGGGAGGAMRGAAGVRVRRGAAGFAAEVSGATIFSGVVKMSAPTAGVTRRRTGFAGVDGVGVSGLAPADSVAGLRLRGAFGGSGSSMPEV